MYRTVRAVMLGGAAAILAAAPAACGGSSANAEAAAGCPQRPTGTAATPTQLTMWAWQIDRKSLAARTDQFNATHPAIHVSVEGTADNQWVTSLHDHSALPDIAELGLGLGRLAVDAKAVIPAQDCFDAAHYSLTDFVPAYLALSKVGTTQWGFPLGYPPTVMYYNRAAFSRAGLDPDHPPATLAQLSQDAEALKGSGIAHPIAPFSLLLGLELTGTALTNAGNGHAGTATATALNTSTTAAAVTAITDLVRDGDVGPPPQTLTNHDALWDIRQIGAGQAAIAIHQGWDLQTISDALAGGQAPGVQLAVAPLPTLNGPGATSVKAPALYVSARSTEARRAAAWTFLRWFEEPAQQAALHASGGWFPTRLSAAGQPAAINWWKRYPLVGDAWAFVTGNTPATPTPFVGINDFENPAVINLFADVQNQKTTVDDSIRSAATRVDHDLSQYNADPVGFCWTQPLLHPDDTCG